MRAVLVVVVAGACIACDQASKHFAAAALASAPPRSYLGDVVRLVYAENAGAFLSLGAELPWWPRFWVFTVGLGLMLAGVALFAVASRRIALWQVAGLALMVGGGLGNWIDRIRHGGLVIDFMNLGVGSWRTGVFNLADLAVEAGGITLVVAFLAARGARDKDRRAGADSQSVR